MTPSTQKVLLGISGVILALSGFSLLHSYKEAKNSTMELNALSNDIQKIGEEMTRLRAQVEAYEKAKSGTATTASAATPAPAATPAK